MKLSRIYGRVASNRCIAEKGYSRKLGFRLEVFSETQGSENVQVVSYLHSNHYGLGGWSGARTEAISSKTSMPPLVPSSASSSSVAAVAIARSSEGRYACTAP